MEHTSLDVQRTIYRYLGQAGHPDAHDMVGWWILQEVTGKDLNTLMRGCPVTDQEYNRAMGIVDELIVTRKPLAYIVGWVPFGALRIMVTPPVLIPRPETESWVVDMLSLERNRIAPRILDMCTGSGCIAVSCAYTWPEATVHAVDIADESVALAQHNSEQLRLTNVLVIPADLQDAWEQFLPSPTQYDLITANPPYVDARDWSNLAPEITSWESIHAHVAPDDGYAYAERIIREGYRWLAPGGTLYMEIGWQQGPRLVAYAQKVTHAQVRLQRDIAGQDRVLVVHKI